MSLSESAGWVAKKPSLLRASKESQEVWRVRSLDPVKSREAPAADSRAARPLYSSLRYRVFNRVSGLGFRIQGLGFRVSQGGSGGLGVGFRNYGVMPG